MTTDVNESTRPLRVGMLGGGFMSSVHTRAARAAGAEVVGVASHSAESAATASARLGIARSYRTVEELLDDGAIDVVHVCTPNESHAALAESVLKSGKHVVCEKPLATSPAQAQGLVELADKTGLVATVPFVYRFHAMVREARWRVAEGGVGRLFSVNGAYLQDWLADSGDDNWRVDPRHGGPSRAFADIGSHLCDLVEFVSGERIARLCAETRTVHDSRSHHASVATEDLVAVVFVTDTGTVGTLHVSQVAPGRKNKLTLDVYGSSSSLVFDQENPEVLHIGGRDGMMAQSRSAELSAASAPYSLVPAGHPQGYQDAFNAFARDTYAAVSGDVADGLPVFRDGHRATVVTAAVLESHRVGGWVDVPLFERVPGAATASTTGARS